MKIARTYKKYIGIVGPTKKPF